MELSTNRRPVVHPSLATAAVAAWAVGLVVIVATDGSPGGRLARAAGVLVVAAAAVWVVERSGRLGGLLLLVLAVAGIDVGVTHGLRFQLEDGTSVVSVAGLLVLVAGLLLAVDGGRRVTADQGGWRVVTVPVLVGVVALAVWNTAPAVLATNVPAIERGDDTPAAHGLDAVDVRFPAADGTALAGWYVPSRNGAAVVVRHGAGSTVTANLSQAAVIAAHGYGILLTDARGHGESAGRAMDFGWYGDDDLAGAVSFLATRVGVDPDRIGVVGFSMGGEEAIGALGADARIRTVVAEGATGRTAADHAWFDDVHGWRGDVQLVLERLEFALTDLLTDAPAPTVLADAVASSAPRRLLLITAGDVADERHAAAHLRATAPGRVVVREFAGAGHTQGIATDPDRWESLVITWLDAELAASTDTAG